IKRLCCLHWALAAMKVLRFFACVLAWLAAFLCAVWATDALYFDFPTAGTLMAILFVVVLLTSIVLAHGKLLNLANIFGAFAILASWGVTVKPSNDTVWEPDCAT